MVLWISWLGFFLFDVIYIERASAIIRGVSTTTVAALGRDFKWFDA